MNNVVTLDEVMQLATQLTTVDKIRLFERLAPELEREVQTATPRESLRGLWQGVDITDEDLAEVRREMWGNFPREDF
jgi:hypothetical protein